MVTTGGELILTADWLLPYGMGGGRPLLEAEGGAWSRGLVLRLVGTDDGDGALLAPSCGGTSAPGSESKQ